MIFISKISKHWIKYSTYEPYFGVNFGNVKDVKNVKTAVRQKLMNPSKKTPQKNRMKLLFEGRYKSYFMIIRIFIVLKINKRTFWNSKNLTSIYHLTQRMNNKLIIDNSLNI